ncbi:hypothetical protein SLEP1_g18014 [Rubroshorea leprosula]|uniref:Phosphatidylethanolamine-binding protein n=1 Tax=Rubroshorea leprosula TaxID=152421 RepID=A0AAV5J7V7_9ROSI|nr:hypothetical protein SLEP1_g18014 [Rubroshorea leprosula]
MASDQDQFRLVSPQINHEGRLPRKYTQEGQGAKKNISPPLEWYNVPEGTKSLALEVEDIDAPDPSGPIVPWTHWVVINIPPTIKGFPEGFAGKEEDMDGDRCYRTSHGHRFQFKLYALDDELHLGDKGESAGACASRSRVDG